MKCLFDEMGDPTLGYTDEHGGVDSDSTIHRVNREEPVSQPLRPGVGPVVLELLAHDDDVNVCDDSDDSEEDMLDQQRRRPTEQPVDHYANQIMNIDSEKCVL